MLDGSELQIRMDSVREAYFLTDRDEHCLAILDRALARADEITRRRENGSQKLIEGRAEIIIGESGSGKSTMVNRALQLHPAFVGYAAGPYPEINKCEWVVSVSIRAPSTTAHFGVELLQAAGYPIVPARPDARIILPLARNHIRNHGIKVIIIDEVHSLTRSKNFIELAKIQDFFRSLLNDFTHPVQLIFVGTEAALTGLNDEDGQLLRRANILRLQPFTLSDAGKAAKIIEKLSGQAGLELHSDNPERLAMRLIHAVRGRLGLMAEFTTLAIELALRTNEQLCNEHFAQVFARQKGVSAQFNPFVAEDFRNIEIKDLFDTEGLDTKKTSRNR